MEGELAKKIPLASRPEGNAHNIPVGSHMKAGGSPQTSLFMPTSVARFARPT